MFAKPAPYTMTKEYQEESNELLIVSYPRSTFAHDASETLTVYPSSCRNKKPTPSPVLPPRATRAPVWSSLLPRAVKSTAAARPNPFVIHAGASTDHRTTSVLPKPTTTTIPITQIITLNTSSLCSRFLTCAAVLGLYRNGEEVVGSDLSGRKRWSRLCGTLRNGTCMVPWYQGPDL